VSCLSPLPGLFRSFLAFFPTACAMGYGLVPLRGKLGVTSYGEEKLTGAFIDVAAWLVAFVVFFVFVVPFLLSML
jgi:hypothetical protein